MNFFKVVILSFGLGVDASMVGVADGVKNPNIGFKNIVLIAFVFGMFQALMPIVGYLLGGIFVEFISNITPYLALVLLCSLGIKMIIESKDSMDVKSTSFFQIIIQGIATSIDALTIGLLFVSFAFIDVFCYCLIIGVITFIMCIFSIFLAKKIGSVFTSKAYLIGGIILILVGLEIFIDYLV